MIYFTLEELCASNLANKLDIDNTPSQEVIENLNLLVDNILDPAREKLKEPIYVNSGFRCEELNKYVGGVKNSQHIRGEAADIYCQHLSNLIEILKTLECDQIIVYAGFVHVSYNKKKNRKQIIYKYTNKR